MIGKLKSILNGLWSNSKYGPDLEAHQQLLMASDILIEIYMAESTILRTEKLPKKKVKTKYRNKSRWQNACTKLLML
jgi:hypothetical protein